jgi:hypothetical protein
MKATNPSLLVAAAGLALAAPGQVSSSPSSHLVKRTGYDLCDSDCKLAGLAYPDKHTIQLPLENNWSEQCPPIQVGPANDPIFTSRVCLDTVGSDIVFNFEPFAGYTYFNAAVQWKLKGNVLNPASWAGPPPPSNNLVCGPNPAGGDGYQCKLPFSDILGVSSASPIKDLLSGMCPNGDREGLVLYLQFSGSIRASSTDQIPLSAVFANSPPCTARDSSGKCTSRDTTLQYIETAYRCSTCNRDACPPDVEPPVTTSCSFGTAFGYREPVGGVPKSFALNTQSGPGCNRWGWYSVPALSDLQASVRGPLYVGAGGNDISKAINVGTWTATANAGGGVFVEYEITPPYTLSEVHVNLACLPLTKCAPGQYPIKAEGLEDVAWYSTRNIQYPACSGGLKPALIVHAAVNKLVQGTTCPAVIE